MTHVGELLQLALAGTFANGLWPTRARDAAPLPYGVFNYSGPEDWYVAERNGKQKKRVQIDIYADGLDAAEALADTVIATMETHNVETSPSMFTATCESRTPLGADVDTKAQRVMLEFSFTFRP